MKAKKEENKEPKQPVPQNNTARAKCIPRNDSSSELNEPRWSVVTFETCAASGLTYDGAAKELEKLRKKKVSGLCIITDEAAQKVNK